MLVRQGAEFELLPHLLVTGALCLVDFLVIDWHLNALPEDRRMAGLGLRHSLGATVRAACPGRPALLIEHEEFRPINFGKPVPGLLDETVRHVREGETRGEIPLPCSTPPSHFRASPAPHRWQVRSATWASATSSSWTSCPRLA